MPELHELAPDFEAKDDEGKLRSLGDYRGKLLVLYFYQKDWSSGCTKEALEFKRLFSEFDSRNTAVVGISRDDVSMHRDFKWELKLPFSLLADPSRKIHESYEVLRLKMIHGEPTIAVSRSTFVIGHAGLIEKVYRDVDPVRHPSKLLEELLSSGLMGNGGRIEADEEPSPSPKHRPGSRPANY